VTGSGCHPHPRGGCVSDPTPDCCDGNEDCNEYEMCDLPKNTYVPIPTDSTGSVETSTPEDTGTPDTGVDDTSGGSGGGGSAASDSGGINTGAGSSGAADKGIMVDSVELPPPGTSGCGCTTTPSPAGRLLWLLASLGLWLRRRRRAA